MKVNIETYNGKDHLMDLGDAIGRQLIGSGEGVIENTQRTGDNCANFLGRLTNLLAEKGIVSVKEINDILYLGLKR